MTSYLFIGGGRDGLNIPAPDDLETVRPPVSVTGSEAYVRDKLTVGAASVTIFRHESLTSDQVLDLFVKHYKAWCVNRPGGR